MTTVIVDISKTLLLKQDENKNRRIRERAQRIKNARTAKAITEMETPRHDLTIAEMLRAEIGEDAWRAAQSVFRPEAQ